MVSTGHIITGHRPIKCFNSITLINFLNYELFLHCQSRDLNRTNVEEKPLLNLLKQTQSSTPECQLLILVSIKTYVEGTYSVPILHLPLHTHVRTHTIPCTPLPFSQALLWEGEESRKQSAHKLELPSTTCFQLQMNLSLSILASCQRSLIFTCSLRFHLPWHLFSVYYPLYFSTCAI